MKRFGRVVTAVVVAVMVVAAVGLMGCDGDNGTGGGGHVHTWGAWVITTPTSCTAAGVETRTCSQDGTTETRAIPQLTGAVCEEGGDISGNNICGIDGTADLCKTVDIGRQTWLAENLNRETENSWCYNNSADSCAKYGRLYTWDAAMTACPSGWRLATRDDWGALAVAAGGTGPVGAKGTAGKVLKSTTGWRSYGSFSGTDEFGFSALPGGWRNLGGGFVNAGGEGCWWTAAEYDDANAYDRNMLFSSDAVGAGTGYSTKKGYGYSVRCLTTNSISDGVWGGVRGKNKCAIDGTADSCDTVKIGSHTWLAENLNKDTAGSWCLYYSADSCGKYGRLYTWAAAKAACQSIGWRLPSRDEWGALVIAAEGTGTAAGKALKSISGWYGDGNGTDLLGFSALPGHYKPGDGMSATLFDGAGGYWWTDTEVDSLLAYSLEISYREDNVREWRDFGLKRYALSVRCIK